MKRVMVRYRVKPDQVEANEALVRAVFEELARERRPVQLAQREDALGHEPRLSAGAVRLAVLLVGDVVAPMRRDALFVNLEQREVRHEAIRRRAVPVLSPGSKKTRSPGPISSTGPPRRCASPSPSVT